jgi:O-antigen/teichoic acid export membrane protein
MQLNVKKNAKRNIFFGMINKIVLLILPFISRSVINITIGADYLGLNSLFTSIIQVLSLTELGFSSALVYNMYKPIAENDHKKINAILNLYRTVYRIIGCCIFGAGLVLIPFLPKLIHGNIPASVNIIHLYLLQLVNTSLSYFLFGYKQSLLVAYQREDVNSIINLVTQVSLQVTQMTILLCTKNYYYYLIVLPFFTVINNLWIGIITKRMYPDAKCEGRLDADTLGDIKKLVVGTFIQRACVITRNSLDSICISAFLGLKLTGIYNNYYSISAGLSAFLGIVSTALAGGIGNHVAIKNLDDNYQELRELDFLYLNISGVVTALFLCLVQPFMILWMGDGMNLSIDSVVLLCLYFYLLKDGDMISIYSSANGLWWKNRYRALGETITNFVLNIVLGKILGVNGIILATIISLFFCNIIWGNIIIFKNYFSTKGMLFKYNVIHVKYGLATVAVCIISYYITKLISFDNLLLTLLVRGVVCCFTCLLYLMIWGRTEICKDSVKLIMPNNKKHGV